MRAMPDQFRCDACHARQPDEWLCLGTFRGPLPWGARPPLRPPGGGREESGGGRAPALHEER